MPGRPVTRRWPLWPLLVAVWLLPTSALWQGAELWRPELLLLLVVFVALRLDVWRDRAKRSVSLKLAERPLPATVRPPATTGGVRPVLSPEQGPLGMTVRDLDAATSKRFTLPDGMTGVMVIDVDSAGPARQARVRRGQVVLEMNRTKIGSVAEFQRMVSALPPGAAVALFVFDPLTGDRAIYSIAIDPA